ncbi:MAG: tyramine oxidase [Acidobacteria bacterium]|nr:MAG: tyramine oxidase [Acidobacteriota bacterium]
MRLRVFVLLWFFLSTTLFADVHHPLDALDASEITSATAILREVGKIEDHTLFASTTLVEPPKAAVLKWKEGDPITRAAKIVLRQNARTFEAIVDLTNHKLISWKEIPGAQPFITWPEIEAANKAAVEDPRMQEGFRKRGLTDFEKLFCAPLTVGNFGDKSEKGKRLLKLGCFDNRELKTDAFARPIEGLFATVDLDKNAVIDVIDLGVVAVPAGNSELDVASVGTQRSIKRVQITTPEGSNIKMENSFVHWQNWSFHLRWDIHAGAVISLLSYHSRSIMYQGSLAEIFVPYQDPTEGWYFRNYMDEGDYGFGLSSSELVSGSDCPESAIYLSPVMSNAAGGVDVLDKRICIFERPKGDPVWRHYDFAKDALQSRPGIELVVRYIATLGNYDYVLDWILDQKGSITYRGGASGVDSVKGVASQRLDDKTATQDTAYGQLITPGRVGTNHDHFLSLRLDLDIDGTQNSFSSDQMIAERSPATSKRRSIWRIHHNIAKTDTDAKFRLNLEHPAMWHVMNSHKKNALGYPVSYMIHSEGNALPLIDPAESPLNRAMFANYHLWVTPYSPDEMYAAGDYPNQSQPGQGLPAWTKNHRSIEDQDIVLWYTLGFHHVPSSEDWPVYNLGWHSVTLQPFNFFDRNPAIDVPPAQ